MLVFLVIRISFAFPCLTRPILRIVAKGASDLHIGEGQPPKMRRHGDVMPIRDGTGDARGSDRDDERNLRAEKLGTF